MKCSEIIEILERLAPLSYAEEWDNPGLLAGRREKSVQKVMVALDASASVTEQAVLWGADMLITHHPMIFRALKQITDQNFIGKKLVALLQKDISYYAMHTNFDCAVMAMEAGKRMGLQEMRALSPLEVSGKKNRFCQQTVDVEASEGQNQIGLGCVGKLPEVISAGELAEKAKKVFGIDYVTYTGQAQDRIQTLAICPGSGKSVIPEAITCHADVLLTGDIDHHTALDAAEQGLSLMDAGHFGTEHFMAEYVKDYLLRETEGSIEVVTAQEKSVFCLLQ